MILFILQVVSTSHNVLSGARANLRMHWIQTNDLSLSSTQVIIPQTTKVILDSQLDLKDNLPNALDVYMIENNFHSLPNSKFEDGILLQVYSSLAIPAGDGDRFGDWPMYVRAMGQFFGLPWFSSVAIQMEGGDANTKTSFGEIRLLFKIELYNVNNTTLSKELALVKMYEELPQSRLSKLIECIELRWCEDYLVIEVDNILRGVHVLPNFSTSNRFFVNTYKF
jgi:hypothetical protein